MSVALIVRSYAGDFHWLELAAQLMSRYLTGTTERILVTPTGHVPSEQVSACFDRHVFSTEDERCDGYIAQQIDKLTAWRWTSCEHLLYVDSDCMFCEPWNASRKLIGGKIELYREKWATVASYGHFWQEVIRDYTGIHSEYEYMRCQPIMHHTETLQAMLRHWPDLLDRARQVTDKRFSEYNCAGIYAAHFDADRYVLSEGPFHSPIRAYWSYGGLTDEVRREIEAWL